MLFRDVRHQDRALRLLQQALRHGRVPHAYLFSGPAGVGKELVARALAARLLCENAGPDDVDACGACVSCGLLRAGTHPDLHVVHRGLHKLHPDRAVRASRGIGLGVDVVRHFVIEPASRSSGRGRGKVFLVLEAERMTDEAQNALLKTLEEPPADCRLILLTSSPARLLPTIRSRCQVTPFDLLPREFIETKLKELGVNAAQARQLAHLAGGQLGQAVAWSQMGLLPAVDAVRRAVSLLPVSTPDVFAATLVQIAAQLGDAELEQADAGEEDADETGEEDSEPAATTSRKAPDTAGQRESVKLVLRLLSELLRDDLHAQLATGRGPGLSAKPLGLGASRAPAALAALQRAEEMIDRNVAPQLACEFLATALRD